VFAVPLLVGSVAYVCGGLVFALGFPRLLARPLVATGGMIESREGALPN